MFFFRCLNSFSTAWLLFFFAYFNSPGTMPRTVQVTPHYPAPFVAFQRKCWNLVNRGEKLPVYYFTSQMLYNLNTARKKKITSYISCCDTLWTTITMKLSLHLPEHLNYVKSMPSSRRLYLTAMLKQAFFFFLQGHDKKIGATHDVALVWYKHCKFSFSD